MAWCRAVSLYWHKVNAQLSYTIILSPLPFNNDAPDKTGYVKIEKTPSDGVALKSLANVMRLKNL